MTLWIVETFIATSVLMLVVLAIRVPVAARFGTRAAYLLWLAPALRMIMPPLPTFLFNAPAQQVQQAVIVMTGVTSPADMSSVVPESGIVWPIVLASLWLGGAAIFFARHIFAYRRFVNAALALAEPVAPGKAIGIRSSAAITSPLAFGIIGKTIIVPHDFATRFDAVEQRLALAHELAHHHRGDPAVNLAALAMLALHWFNPVAHIAHRAFRLDQEAACDAIVLHSASPSERHAYGTALFKAATGPVPLALCAMAGTSTLKTRLRRIASHRTAGGMLVPGGVVALTLVSAGLLLTASNGVAARSTEAATALPRAIVIGGGIIDTGSSDTARTAAETEADDAEAAVKTAETAADAADRASVGASDESHARADVARANADLARARADLARGAAEAARAEAEAAMAAIAPPQPPEPPLAGDNTAPPAPPAPPSAKTALKVRCPEGSKRQVMTISHAINAAAPKNFQIVICLPDEVAMRKTIADALKSARNAIASQPMLSPLQRQSALAELNREIDSLSAKALKTQ